MPTDYDKLREENIGRYGSETAHLAILGELYAERTHFIFELLQNSEDAKAKHVRFDLSAEGLDLLHDGRKFNDGDVRAVSSVCQSTSEGDSERIGRFGIGFKSVYCYTATPEIHSGEEHFAIEHYVRPKAVTHREIVKGQSTLITLPFNSPSVVPKTAFDEIDSALQHLDERALLFLRRVESLEVSIEDKNGIILCREITSSPENWIRIVSLDTNDGSDNAQRWLVAEKTCKLKGASGKPVSARVEIAFALASTESDSEIEVEYHDGATLAVFFPTDKPTNTGFILQGPYRTTPARDNILVNDPINERLVLETCELLVEMLRWFRDRDCLTVEVFNTLPLSRANFPDGSLLCPLFARVLTALKEEPLLPAHPNSTGSPKFICGNQAVAASDPELRELLTNDQLKEALGADTEWRWLSEDISLDDKSELAVYLRDEVEIQEFTAEDFVSWLETKDADWWKAQDEKYLLSAYRYLNAQSSEHKRLSKLPLVRLESGEHVSPDEQAVFFPSDNIHEKKELAPFLSQLPIIRLSLLDDDGNDQLIAGLLRKVGVLKLQADAFVRHVLVPLYTKGSGITVGKNQSHVRYLFHVFQRHKPEERKAWLNDLNAMNWLLCRKASDPEKYFLGKPGELYLSKAYTGTEFTDVFFEPSREVQFVDQGYPCEGESWLQFLCEIGCASLPRRSSDKHQIVGLEKALACLKTMKAVGDRIKLVNSILSVIGELLPDQDWERESCFQVQETILGPRGGYHGNRSVDALFWATLKQTYWLPDADENQRRPNALFLPTKQNRNLLGNSVFYLHNDVCLDEEAAKWIARELGIRFTPNKDAVLTRLKKLRNSELTAADVTVLYQYFSSSGADVAADFEESELIFCPDSDQKWHAPSKVFWNDESPIFGITRAYLRKHYPALQEFFSKAGVASNVCSADYAEALLEIAKSKAVDDASRDRIHRIYKRLSPLFDERGDWKEETTWMNYWGHLADGRFWLGRNGSDFGFFPLCDLVVVDNEHLENLFHGSVAFWPFKDLNDFAKEHLKIDVCSAAEQDFQVENKGSQQDALSEQLANSWSCVGDFLQSDKWRNDVVEGRKFSDNPPLIRIAGRIAVTYTLKEVAAEEPDGKVAFFDSTENTVWLVPGDTTESEEHFEALSEALQEYFGPEPLREFVFDLLRKGIEKAEVKWRKRGLMSRHDFPAEPQPTEPAPSNSCEKLKVASASVAPTAERNEGEAGQSENTPKSSEDAVAPDTHVNPPSTKTKGMAPAPFSDKLKHALNKPGKAAESQQAPERSSVSNPERRREQTEKEISAAREKEPRQNERQKVLPRTVWESKNPDVRGKLKVWYRGSCQICSETFRKRDGENYFEACYLVSTSADGAGWVDRVGNVLCLCADCSAKFQFGSIESPSNIQKKIADLRMVKEGGTQPHIISIRLCDEDVAITFDERHLIDLQSMLKAEHSNEAPDKHPEPSHQTKPLQSVLVQCPHCQSKVRSDRLVKHVRDVHGQGGNAVMQRASQFADVKTRRCKKGCGRPALLGAEYCSRCM